MQQIGANPQTPGAPLTPALPQRGVQDERQQQLKQEAQALANQLLYGAARTVGGAARRRTPRPARSTCWN